MKTKVKGLHEFLGQQVCWTSTNDPVFPWEAAVRQGHGRLRINDFPQEPLYSLFVNGKHIGDLDDWPACWKKHDSAGGSAKAQKSKAAALA